MDIGKLGASQTRPVICHNLRDLADGKATGNEAIDQDKTCENYSLINRGNTVKEVNKYRLDLEKEIFQYNRKNLVHTIQAVIQLPRDCPPEQEKDFFQACHDFFCEWFPMGERSIFVSQVHMDELYKDHDGNIVLDSDGNVLSKHHMHIMGIPAVRDTKHPGYEWKLCADQLTKRNQLKMLHPQLQRFLDEKGIHATVYDPKISDGKTIKLSVKQLKEITAKTGLTVDKSLSVEKLAEILAENRDIKIYDQKLMKAFQKSEQERKVLSSEIEKISQNEVILSRQIQELKEENHQLKQTINLQQERLEELEKLRENQREKQQEHSGWNKTSSWDKKQTYSTERTW